MQKTVIWPITDIFSFHNKSRIRIYTFEYNINKKIISINYGDVTRRNHNSEHLVIEPVCDHEDTCE